MGQIQTRHEGVSQCRVCRWLRLRRCSIYGQKVGKGPTSGVHTDASLLALMKKVRGAHQAWGFRLIFAHLKHKGEKVGKRRAYRLYVAAKMSLHGMPQKPRIKRVFDELLPPKQINEGWAMDFLSEWVIGPNQQSVRVINVVDECSRKDLWVEAAHSITAAKLTETLDQIGQMCGWPRYSRCDNGPEFISHTLQQWAEDKRSRSSTSNPENLPGTESSKDSTAPCAKNASTSTGFLLWTRSMSNSDSGTKPITLTAHIPA